MLFFVSADNGGPVARGKEPFLCSFLDIEISKFRKDFHTFKKMDPRILSNSERFLLQKNLQNDELTNYLLARLKLQDR